MDYFVLGFCFNKLRDLGSASVVVKGSGKPQGSTCLAQWDKYDSKDQRKNHVRSKWEKFIQD